MILFMMKAGTVTAAYGSKVGLDSVLHLKDLLRSEVLGLLIFGKRILSLGMVCLELKLGLAVSSVDSVKKHH